MHFIARLPFFSPCSSLSLPPPPPSLSLSCTHTHMHTHNVTDLPGAPTLQGISMSYDSLIIQLTLSNDGTPPILSLVVEFIAPEPFTRNFSGPFIPGGNIQPPNYRLVDSTVTQYSFTVNYQGRWRASQMHNSTTGKWGYDYGG